MGLILQRLSIFKKSAWLNHEDQQGLSFYEPDLSSEDCNLLVKKHLMLQIEYSVHCTQLAADLLKKPAQDLLPQIEDALKMASILHRLYAEYLNVPSEALGFLSDQIVYKELLSSMIGKYAYIPSTPLKPEDSLSKSIRQTTARANLMRLFTARVRRFMVLLFPMIGEQGACQQIFGAFDTYAFPVLSYASWLFFIPRIFNNLFFIAKHLLPGQAWMGAKERSLHWKARFSAHVDRHWFELGNDFAAFTVNSMLCFLLIGSLMPIAFYVGWALLLYDVILAGIRIWVELNRLYTIKKEYKLLVSEFPGKKEQYNDYLSHLQERISYEKKRLASQFLVTNLLVLAFALTSTFWIINPVIPLMGAILAVLTTIMAYAFLKYFEHHKPQDKLATNKIRFFKPEPSGNEKMAISSKNDPIVVTAF